MKFSHILAAAFFLAVSFVSFNVSAEITPMTEEQMHEVSGQTGIIIPAILDMKDTELSANDETVTFGYPDYPPLLTLKGVSYDGFVDIGRSTRQDIYAPSGNGELVETVLMLDNFRIYIHSYRIDAIYPGSETEGKSFGAIEISNFDMYISGKITITPHN